MLRPPLHTQNMTTIELLPPEILYNHLLPCLYPEDIVNLGKCFPIVITESLYKSTFHDNTHYHEYNMEMFARRTRARMFFMGAGKSPDFEPTRRYHDNFEWVGIASLRMHTPWRIDLEETIVQIVLGGHHVCALTSSGEIYRTSRHYRKREKPYLLRKLLARENRVNNWGDIDWMLTPTSAPSTQLQAESERIFHRHMAPTRFTEMYYGGHLLAKDADGLVWFWDEKEAQSGKRQGRPILRFLERGRMDDQLVSGITSDPHLILAALNGGKVFAADLGDQHLLSPNGIHSGYPCLNRHMCLLEGEVRSLGSSEISCLELLGKGWLGYLDSTGVMRLASLERPQLNTTENQSLADLNALGPFVQMVTSPQFICLLRKDGYVVTAATVSHTSDELCLGQFDMFADPVDVVSLATGSRHLLMLTSTGDVYSYGGEYKYNGCLGLGPYEYAIKRKHVFENHARQRIYAAKPVKIPLPGKVLAIAADHNYSAFMIDDVNKIVNCPMRVRFE